MAAPLAPSRGSIRRVTALEQPRDEGQGTQRLERVDVARFRPRVVVPGGFPVVVLLVALALSEMPLLLATYAAPEAARGLGCVWFINDFAQYESAIRQGAQQSSWLVHDVFTPEPHRPALMFTLYVALGKLGHVLHVEPMFLERLTEIGSRALMVLALWRFCSACSRSAWAARAATLLALFGTGFEVLATLFGLRGVYSGNWSYETNTFGLLFGAPHVALAMAATLELARCALIDPRWLEEVRGRGIPTVQTSRQAFWTRALARVALLSASIALLQPFHLPVVLAAIAVFAVVRRCRAGVAVAGAACLGALPVLAPTVLTFTLDPFWSATYSLQNVLPSPSAPALLVELGAPLLLAACGLVILPRQAAPPGLLIWLALALVAMYLPLPYQRRLSFGVQPVVAVLASPGLVAIADRLGEARAKWFRLGVVGLAGNGTALVLVSIVSSSLTNSPLPIYRSTVDLDAAANWLGQHTQPGEVILADWDVSNYLAPRTPARVVGGHPVATLHAPAKQSQIAAAFDGSADVASVARQYAAEWIVYGPNDAPPGGELARDAVYASGGVRVYRFDDRPHP